MSGDMHMAKAMRENALVAMLFATTLVLAASLVVIIMRSTPGPDASPKEAQAEMVVLDAQTAETVAQNLVTLEESNAEMRRQLKEKDEIVADLTKRCAEERSRADEAGATAELEKKRADDAEQRASELQDQIDEMGANAQAAPVEGDVADLTITQAEVVAWAARIDRYLEGTALGGYGQTFAQAACDYGVDPRLSPAIAVLESSAGAYLPAPHNAWGWGGPGNWASWPDWETAIREHTKGLAENGYMPFDQEAGTRYCDSGYWSCLKPVIDGIGSA